MAAPLLRKGLSSALSGSSFQRKELRYVLSLSPHMNAKSLE
jgi:hypothetical protein